MSYLLLTATTTLIAQFVPTALISLLLGVRDE